MKNIIFLICILYITFNVSGQNKKSELFINSGFNYGSTSDFKNTPYIKLKNRASFNFSMGARLYFKKYENYCIEFGAGLNSVDPIFFISKNNFSPNNTAATDFYSFLPPIYEFFKVNMNFLRSIKIVETKKTKTSLVIGAGVQYLPPIYASFDWNAQDMNGNESISHTILFDQRNNNNAYNTANRKLIYNAYIGLNVSPTIFTKNWLHFEFFWNPSFNSGVTSAFVLTLPNIQIDGHQNFTFSNYGLKIMVTIPKINLKPK